MYDRVIRLLQYATVSVMWVFSLAITVWVVKLGLVSHELSDAFTMSVGITIVALPIYWSLAGILTYTFFGLRRGAKDKRPE